MRSSVSQSLGMCVLVGFSASVARAEALEQDLPYAWTGGPIWLWLILAITTVTLVATLAGLFKRSKSGKPAPRARKLDREAAWSRTEDQLAPPKPTATRLPHRDAPRAKPASETPPVTLRRVRREPA